MFDPILRSKLAPSIRAFVEQKMASGYPYKESFRSLSHLDAMVYEKFPESDSLTKEICDCWIELSSRFHQNTLLRRVTPIRQYGKYLLGIGKPAYIIPGGIPNKQIRYDAHIFTERELTAFFRAIDQCPESSFSHKCYTIPVIFRMLYSTGVRSSEARRLRMEDVDLNTGKIFIRKSKGWEARVIYASSDLLDLMNRYDSIVRKAYPEREAFFPNRKGTHYSQSTIDSWFHEFWDNLPEAADCKGNAPRVHDFRHTYCVYRLNQWVREKKDLNALYPYLSEYVGHSNFSDTDYYLTLAEPFYPELQKRMSPVNSRILPEVPNAN